MFYHARWFYVICAGNVYSWVGGERGERRRKEGESGRLRVRESEREWEEWEEWERGRESGRTRAGAGG